MPNLSIKNVPQPVVERLRARAAANHRSLQGELMALVCQAASDRDIADKREMAAEVETGWKSIGQILSERKAAKLSPTTEGPRAVDLIREDRDAR